MAGYSDDPLWRGVADFELDDPAAQLSFTRRLARENGWTAVYAGRVVAEYKRFCYLALRAGHPVTPSDEVDQAWHLHLTYTKGYWDDFCGEVLGRPLHHGPTRGGKAEGAKFHDWYGATLDSYRRLFGDAPPADVWPDPDDRFRDAAAFRRVNTASHWLVPKPNLRAAAPAGCGLAVVTVTLAACTQIEWAGEVVGWFFFAGVVAALIFGIAATRTKTGTKKSGQAGGVGVGGYSGCGDLGDLDSEVEDDEARNSGDSAGEGDGGDSAGGSDSGDSGGGGDSGCGGSGCGGCGGD